MNFRLVVKDLPRCIFAASLYSLIWKLLSYKKALGILPNLVSLSLSQLTLVQC